MAFRDTKTWLFLILGTSILALGINFIGLLAGIASVLPNLLYFPIVIAAYRYPGKGVYFAVCLGLAYLLIVFSAGAPGIGGMVSAVARVFVFVAIGGVVSWLSISLKKEEERYRGLFDHSEAGSFLTRLEGQEPFIEEVNFRGGEILGYRIGELHEKPMRTLWVDPGKMDLFISVIRKNGVCYSFASHLVKKDGTIIEIFLSAGAIPDHRFIVTLVDVTDWKNADDALRQANKELNLLSGILREDLLSVTARTKEFLDQGKPAGTGPEMPDLIAEVERSLSYIRCRLELTKGYQDMGAEEPVWHRARKEILAEVSRLDPKNVSVRVWVERLEIYGDRMVRNVFYHLIDNAIRHGGRTTEIVVTYRLTGNGLDLVFEDNGTGIPERDKALIFTYEPGRLPGHGLFIDRQILGITGMTIEETGVFGAGARFEIHIPRTVFRIL